MQPHNLLNRERVRAVCVSIIAINALMLAFLLFSYNPDLGGDFSTFYNAGGYLNHGQNIYQQGDALLPFLNPPFFAIPFQAFALLPYRAAYGLWLLIAILVYVAGFQILWPASRLPDELKTDALLIILAFVPFQLYVLEGGQQSWFGFFWLALTFRLEFRKKDFLAGLALSVCLYKPTLLLIILPALLLRGRFKLLSGFAVGGLVLVLISLVAVGTSGCSEYTQLMVSAARNKTSTLPVFPLWKYVDLVSFCSLLVHRSLGIWVLLAAIVAVWATRPRLVESVAWGLPINIYTPMYDVTLLAIPALLCYRGRSSRERWLYVALFLTPWVSEFVARRIGIQIMTILLMAFGVVIRNSTICPTNARKQAGTLPKKIVHSLIDEVGVTECAATNVY
jgi:hypothetical protein